MAPGERNECVRTLSLSEADVLLLRSGAREFCPPRYVFAGLPFVEVALTEC